MVNVFVNVGENCVTLTEKDLTLLVDLLGVDKSSPNLNIVRHWITGEKEPVDENYSQSSEEKQKEVVKAALEDLQQQLKNYHEKQSEESVESDAAKIMEQFKKWQKDNRVVGLISPRVDYW